VDGRGGCDVGGGGSVVWQVKGLQPASHFDLLSLPLVTCIEQALAHGGVARWGNLLRESLLWLFYGFSQGPIHRAEHLATAFALTAASSCSSAPVATLGVVGGAPMLAVDRAGQEVELVPLDMVRMGPEAWSTNRQMQMLTCFGICGPQCAQHCEDNYDKCISVSTHMWPCIACARARACGSSGARPPAPAFPSPALVLRALGRATLRSPSITRSTRTTRLSRRPVGSTGAGQTWTVARGTATELVIFLAATELVNFCVSLAGQLVLPLRAHVSHGLEEEERRSRCINILRFDSVPRNLFDVVSRNEGAKPPKAGGRDAWDTRPCGSLQK